MKKQTKLVAVLSTASLLAIGASMTSFAATGWAEEDGTWVYYESDGDRATEEWKKSGNSWYYLDDNGEMAIDQLIEDDDDYYYVDINGVMATNQWVAIENEDAGDDDEPDQNWYYFQSNGKALTNGDNDSVSLKTINGKKYAFDEFGAMVAEWSLDTDDLSDDYVSTSGNVSASGSFTRISGGTESSVSRQDVVSGQAADALYTQAWKYFSDVEDGARVSKGWFKVVPAEYLNESKYDDDEDYWYYADGSGNLYAGEFKTINGKKYAFRDDGRMLSGLKFIYEDEDSDHLDVFDDDDDNYRFDSEDDFNENAPLFEAAGYKCYYFGDSEDGAMRTNTATVEIDGESFSFYFEKSGGDKGAGLTGEKDDKYYQSGKLLEADSDDKYSVVKATEVYISDTLGSYEEVGSEVEDGRETTVIYEMLEDAEDLLKNEGLTYWDKDDLEGMSESTVDSILDAANINKDLEDLDEVYIFIDGTTEKASPVSSDDYFVVNTSGKVSDSKGRHKDGNDYVYALTSGGDIAAIYVED